MADEQMKQLQQKTMQLTTSKEAVTRVEDGFRVAANEGMIIATIPEIVTNAQFLNDNRNNHLIVSAKNALDASNEILKEGYYKIDRKEITRSTFEEARTLNWDERLYISAKTAEIIKKTKEDGEERLLVFDVFCGCYWDGLAGYSHVWSGLGALVAGKRDGSPQTNVLELGKGDVLEIERGGQKTQMGFDEGGTAKVRRK